MESQKNTKGCLIKEHKNPLIFQICIDKDCQQKSRTLCPECLVQTKTLHQNCQSHLIFQDYLTPKLSLYNPQKDSFSNLIDFLTLSQKEISDKIDTIYDNLLQEIADKLSELKKNQKIKMMESLINSQKAYENLLEQNKNLHDLSTLEEQLKNFQNHQISIEELNKILENHAKFNLSNQEKETLQAEIQEKIDSEELIFFDNSKLKAFQEQISTYLQNFSLYKSSSQIHLQHLEEYNPYNNFSNITQDANNSMIMTRISNQRKLQLITCPFSSKDQVKLKFTLKNLSSNLYIGVLNTRQLLQNLENGQYTFSQLCSSCTNISSSSSTLTNFFSYFKRTGTKTQQETYKENQIYEVTVCVDKNLFRINDQNKQCIIEFKSEFNNNIVNVQQKQWHIIIGDDTNPPSEQEANQLVIKIL